MTGLLCVLWLLYLSECFARWRPGDWVFRPSALGGMQAVNEPDVTFLDGRFAFVWTTLLPWRTAHVSAGSAFDGRRDRSRLADVSAHLTPVRVFSTALFAVLLVVFPALVLTNRFSPFAVPLAAAFGLAWAGTFATFFQGFRRVHGARPAAESWVLLALSPVDLIRAPHVVALRCGESVHPVAAAEALCADEELLRIARLWHFDAPPLRGEIMDLLERRGLRARLTAPPSSVETGLALYCARCHSMFREGAAVCPDCGDVELKPLPGAHVIDAAAVPHG
jgi:hypothetical protein